MGLKHRFPSIFKMNPLSRSWGGYLLLPLVMLQAGCFSKRAGYSVPEVPLPAQYRNSLVNPPAKPSAAEPGSPDVAIEPPPPPLPPDSGAGLVEWWHAFGSDELEGLIDRGMANNADVRMATLRILQAKARADQAGAGRLPSISMPLVSATQYPASGTTVGTAPTANGSSSGTGSNTSQDTLQAYVRGDYRLDVWGEQSALMESAGLQLWRASFERDNTKRVMAATLASYYVEYIALNDRLRVAKETETVLAATLATIEKRVAAGDATLSELEQQRAAVFSLRSSIPSMEQQREDDINSIAFLVGTVPGGLSLSEGGLDSLTLPQAVPGLPSSLLLRRPDVRMAEARMLAADADLDVARARILPPVDLSAQMGYSSLTLSQLFLPQALFWNTVTNLTVNIFDAGKRSNEKVYNQAVQEEMVEAYVRTIYQAMREVEGALASIRLAEKRLIAQRETIGAARRAWDISTKIYAVGGIDYLTLLETERSYHRYLDEYQRIRMDHYRGYISLFQALGGGIQPSEKTPGKGARPTVPADAAPIVSRAEKPAKPNVAGEGIGWGNGRSLQLENFWQVEITGLYDRSTIGSVWRDLRNRYPEWMEGRMLRPRLHGQMDDDGQESWYRLYVAKFDSPALAAGFCADLNANQQRCRVVSSKDDEETVVVAPGDIKSLDRPIAANKPVTPAEDKAAENAAAIDSIITTPAVEMVLAGGAADVPRDATRNRSIKSTARASKRKGKGKTVRTVPVVSESREKLAYAVQLGAFANKENAALALAFWKQKSYDVYVSENRDAGQRTLYVVRTGVYGQRREAAIHAQTIRAAETVEALVVPMMVDSQGKPTVLELEDPATADVSTMAPAVPELPEAAEPSDSAAKIEKSGDVAPPVGTEKAIGNAPVTRRTTSKPIAYAMQLGAFSSPENAKVAFEFWRDKGRAPYISNIKDAAGRQWYAVRSGRYIQRHEALTAALQFGKTEGMPVTVVPIREVLEEAVPADSQERVKVSIPPAATSPESIPQTAPEASQETSQEVAPVVFSEESLGMPAKHGAYTVQLAAFAKPDNAAKALAQWERRGYPVYVSRLSDAQGDVRYALRAGNFETPKAGLALIKKLDRKTRRNARLTTVGIEDADRLSRDELSDLN